jgi:hypothetical protein
MQPSPAYPSPAQQPSLVGITTRFAQSPALSLETTLLREIKASDPHDGLCFSFRIVTRRSGLVLGLPRNGSLNQTHQHEYNLQANGHSRNDYGQSVLRTNMSVPVCFLCIA